MRTSESETVTLNSLSWPGEPTAHLLRPPSSALKKMRYYSRKYGLLHALCASAGRSVPLLWRLTGPVVSRLYLGRWFKRTEPKRINLGGGGVISDEWLCVDVDPHADVYMDLRSRLNIPDASVDAVFLEEIFEHFNREDGSRILKECTRILKPGGKFRVITPDLCYFAERCLRGTNGSAEINEIFYGHGHAYLYTPYEMHEVLDSAGLVSIRQSHYRDGQSELARFDSHPARFNHPAEISQYWDAQRPW